MRLKGGDQEVSFGSLLEDMPMMDDVRLEGGFFSGLDRGEWIRNLEHHFRYGEELLMLWGDPGVGKSTLITQLASRLDPEVYTVVTLDAKRGGSAEHLWGALDRRLTLPHGAEGWEALKRTAKKLASSGQSLAIIIDHADKLSKEAVQLLRAMLDVRLPECRFVLTLDGTGDSAHGQWPVIEVQLFEKGQVARLWPFKEEDAEAYVEFRLQHANLDDVILTDKQKQGILTRSQGNAGVIRYELQRLLNDGALVGMPAKPARKTSAAKNAPKSAELPSTKDAQEAPAAHKKPKKPKQPWVLPKAHTVAMSVLAVALLGFYLVWEQPVPSSVISTPSPTAQNLPPVVKSQKPVLPMLSEIENNPPASGGLPSPVKSSLLAADETATAPAVDAVDGVEGWGGSADSAASRALGSRALMQPPAGFVPSNVPLMSTEAVEGAAKTPSASLKTKSTMPPHVKDALTTGSQRSMDSAPASLAPAPVTQPKSPVARSAAQVVPKALPVPKPVAKPAPKPVAVAKATPVSLPKSSQAAKAAPVQGGGPFTLQIMGLKDLRSVQAVMQRNAGVKGLRYHTGTLNGEPWYVIVQGEYPSRQAAQSAAKSLPAALQASKPFPKSVSALP